MTQFRFHRGSLDASMATAREVANKAELSAAIQAEAWEPGEIAVKPYGFDDRIGWDTYIVTLNGAAVGFCNGPLSD